MRNINRLALLALLAFVLAPPAAQPQTLPEKFRFFVDYARFRGDDEHTYIELYFSFPQRVLTYKLTNGEFEAGVDLTVLVSRKDSIVYADRSLVPHKATDTTRGAMNLISIKKLMLPQGEYTLTVIGKDQHELSRRDSLSMRMPISLPTTEKLVLSDIELASSITKGSPGTPLYKNTFEVVPNVDGLFSATQMCYYYAEAYNLQAGNDQSDFVWRTAIYNAIGQEVISRERPRRRSAESTVLVDNIDLSNLRSGVYSLVLSLHDSSKKAVTTAGKKFFVYNEVLGIDSTLVRTETSIGHAAFLSMEEPELDLEFKWARYEATDAEKSQFSKLEGATAKRKFMADFWAKRPLGTREEYLKRVGYANRTFNVLGMEGYRSDRGRVHILYGPPDDIERHPNEAGTRPYEIWQYNNIQGGVIFVFVLRQNGGDYEQVHSTHRNELHDENWYRFAQTN